MDKTIFKAGQEVMAKQDFDIDGFFGEEPIHVKAGSKGYISADGFLHHTTGAARGKIQKLAEDKFEVKGYDHENIAKMVWNRICIHFGFYEVLEDYDIEEKNVLDEIEDILSDIL